VPDHFFNATKPLLQGLFAFLQNHFFAAWRKATGLYFTSLSAEAAAQAGIPCWNEVNL
jgi:hypothetical protein